MEYADGGRVKAGDKVIISGQYSGVIIAVIDDPECSEAEAWSYLKNGVMIDTDFGGLVQYYKEDFLEEDVVLKN